MIRTFITTLLTLTLMAISTSAMALPICNTGWETTGSDYFTVTDSTTNGVGDASFMLVFDNPVSGYDIGFGIYNYDDGIVTKAEVFSKEAGISTLPPSAAVYLKEGSVAVNHGEDVNTMSYTPFGNTFGFYFDIYNKPSGSLMYTWYTDQSLNSDANGNSVDTDLDHILVRYNENLAAVNIFLSADPGAVCSFSDEIVHGDDVAPVPEPATICLFGLGLIGLASKLKLKA